MTHVIDTNCLLSFVTDRNLEQNRRIAVVLKRASRLEEQILLISNVISEFVYPESLLSLWPGSVPDFGDAVVAAAAKTL